MAIIVVRTTARGRARDSQLEVRHTFKRTSGHYTRASLALGLTAAHRHQDGASGTDARMIEVVDLSANVQINNTYLCVQNRQFQMCGLAKPWPSQTSTHPALAGSVQ